MRILGIVVGVAALAGVALWIGVFGVFPLVSDAPGLVMDHSSARIERGAYLVNTVMGYRGCHSVRRLDRYSSPPVAGKEFASGLVFDEALGFPGSVVSPNITPSRLRSWTDGEILRALTAGVSRDGEPLFPLMPWQSFGTLAEEDIYSAIAYLRTIAPVASDPPASRLYFPVNLIVRFLLPGLFLARSANITPHTEAGIGAWTREQFITRFRATTEDDYRAMEVAHGEHNTVMPWWEFAGMGPKT